MFTLNNLEFGMPWVVDEDLNQARRLGRMVNLCTWYTTRIFFAVPVQAVFDEVDMPRCTGTHK